MHVVFLGAPGSGKGTQAKLLAQRAHVPAISTGAMLREAVRLKTAVGLQARAVMEAGELVSDDLMNELVRARLSEPDARQGFILDGFPRTVDQAAALDRMAAGNGSSLSAVINLFVPEPVIVDRLHGRSAEEHRTDDRHDTILERLRIYHNRTEPLLGHYRGRHLLVDVDGIGDVDEIAGRIDKALEAAAQARGAA